MTENGPERGYALFEWIGRHVWPIAAVMLVIAVALASFGLAVADDTEPSFAPTGEIYTTQDRVEDVFESSSPVRGAVFIAEAASGDDVLTRDALLELKRNQEALRTDHASQQYLMTAVLPRPGHRDRRRLLGSRRGR